MTLEKQVTVEEQGFQKLEPKMYGIYMTYLEKMEGELSSTLDFFSLMAWKEGIPIYIKPMESYLIAIALPQWSKTYVFLPMLGQWKTETVDDYWKQIQELSSLWQQTIHIVDMAEWMIPYIEASLGSLEGKYKLTYHKENSDYIYEKEAFVHQIQRQRHAYDHRYFIRKYQPQVIQIHKEDARQLSDFVREHWCQAPSCPYCTCGCMSDAVYSVVSCEGNLPYIGYKVYSENQLIGFTMFTQRRETLNIHLKYVLRGYRGMNEYIHSLCLEHSHGVKYINYTEDMGQVGLKNYKQRLSPYFLQHRYEILEK